MSMRSLCIVCRRAVSRVVQTARLVDKGPLRASVQVTLTVSDHSTLTQTIHLDAGCPYLAFHTQVHMYHYTCTKCG